jgi:hypothetical protein
MYSQSNRPLRSLVGEADIQATEVPVVQELPDDEILLAAE